MAGRHSESTPDETGRTAAPKVLRISTHRDLLRHRKRIIAAISAKPELLPLLALNPVLAFRDAGAELSPAVADHVLRSVQHPPAIRAERERLIAELREQLTQLPRPTDPAWVAQTLFERWELTPLDTHGAIPIYHKPIPEDALERLRALVHRRPSAKQDEIPAAQTSATLSRPPLVRIPDSLLRLNLDAPVPTLPPAECAPQEVMLTQLWFYGDAHPLVRPLLRLGIIERGALPIFTPDGYRKAKSGEKRNQLLRWVKDVRFPSEDGPGG